MKFYIATKETRKKLLELDKGRDAAMELRHLFVGRFKGKGSVSRGSQMIGIVFTKDPPSPWVYSKKFSATVPATHIPDRSADGKKVRAEMESLTDPVNGFVLAEILNVQPMFLGRYVPPQFAVYRGKAIIGLDDRSDNPVKSKRISDVQYEKLLALMKQKQKRPVARKP